MTLYLFFIGTFLAGFSCINFIDNKILLLEKIGLSFLIGVGLLVSSMVIFQFISIPIGLVSLSSVIILFIIVFNIKEFKNKHFWGSTFKFDTKIQFTYAWFFFGALILYFLYAIIHKGMYWPPAEYDSLTGFDLQAKMIAEEGTLNTSIFQYPSKSGYETSRFFYPPFTAGALSLAYICSEDNSKITIILLFVSFLVSFYALLRKLLKDTWAIMITFFVMVTPEMYSHASFALTNLPNAIYTSLSFICLYFWLTTRQKSYFILSLLLIIFTILSRSDSIVFLAATGIVFAVDYLQTKQWKLPLIYMVVAIIPFVAWSFFVKNTIGADSSEFIIKEIFWDGDKFSMIFGKCITLILGNSAYYGITFYLFLVMLSLNIVDVFQKRHPLALYIMASWFLYTLLYYQLDYDFAGNVDAYINASYKRGMFNFVPLCWFFIGNSPFSTIWINKLNIKLGMQDKN